MFFRILRESFCRGARPKALVGLAILLGAALITALFSFTLEVGDKIGRELRQLGANLTIRPRGELLPIRVGEFQYQPVNQEAFIPESNLVRIKEMFWRNNIVAFAPYLTVPVQMANGAVVPMVGTWFSKTLNLSSGEMYQTGVRSVCSWWTITGQWVDDREEAGVLVGEEIAQQQKVNVGDPLDIRYMAETTQQTRQLIVRGILHSGGEEDKQIFVPLALAQKLSGLAGKVRRVQVSALTKPDDTLARKDPKQMTPKEYDLWYCSPYVSSLAYQLKEVLPDIEVKPVRQVVEVEGAVLTRTELIVFLITLATLVSMSLAVASTTNTTILQRQSEIALMKAIGASNAQVVSIFLVEATFLGILGGMLGFGLGALMTQILGQSIFGSSIRIKFVLLPLIVLISGAIALLGSSVPLRKGLRVDPSQILHQS